MRQTFMRPRENFLLLYFVPRADALSEEASAAAASHRLEQPRRAFALREFAEGLHHALHLLIVGENLVDHLHRCA